MEEDIGVKLFHRGIRKITIGCGELASVQIFTGTVDDSAISRIDNNLCAGMETSVAV